MKITDCQNKICPCDKKPCIGKECVMFIPTKTQEWVIKESAKMNWFNKYVLRWNQKTYDVYFAEKKIINLKEEDCDYECGLKHE